MKEFIVGKYYKPIVEYYHRQNISIKMREMWDGKPHKCISVFGKSGIEGYEYQQLANFEGVEPIEDCQHGHWYWYPEDFKEVNDIQFEFEF